MWLLKAPIDMYQQWERLVLSRAASSQTYCTNFRFPSLSWNPLHRMREKSQIDPSLNKSCYYPPPRHRISARGHEEVPKPSYCFLVTAELCLLRLSKDREYGQTRCRCLARSNILHVLTLDHCMIRVGRPMRYQTW